MNTRKKNTKQKLQSNLNPAATETLAVTLAKSRTPSGAKIRLSALRKRAMMAIDSGERRSVGLVIGDWTPQKNEGLKQDVVDFDAAYTGYHQMRQAAKQATVEFNAVVAEAEVYQNRLVAALTIASKGDPNPFQEERLHRTGTKKSAVRLGTWFGEVVDKVEEYKAPLQALFGEDPVALTRAHAAKLMSALGAQSNGLLRVPTFSKEQRAARLKLVLAIEEQRDAALFAFAGNKEVLREFTLAWRPKAKSKPAPSSQTSAPASPAEQSAATQAGAEAQAAPKTPAAAPEPAAKS